MPFPTIPRKILVIDDEQLVAETLALILTRHGFDATVAHSAEDAIDRIANWRPDVAFVDIMLPGMNGIDFAALLKAEHPGCEVSLMSGHPEAAVLIEQARKAGRPVSVLPKPLDPRKFIEIACGAASSAVYQPQELHGADLSTT